MMIQVLFNLCQYEKERGSHWAETWSLAWISPKASAILKRKRNSQVCLFLVLRDVSEGWRTDSLAEGISCEVCVSVSAVVCVFHRLTEGGLLPYALLPATTLCWARLQSLRGPPKSVAWASVPRVPPVSHMRPTECHLWEALKDRWFVCSCIGSAGNSNRHSQDGHLTAVTGPAS